MSDVEHLFMCLLAIWICMGKDVQQISTLRWQSLQLSDKDQDINYNGVPTSKYKHSWNEWKGEKFQHGSILYKENLNVNVRIKKKNNQNINFSGYTE